MPVTTPCPDLANLRSLLLGELPPNDLERIGEHVLTCDRCASSMSGLQLDDPLLRTLRGGDTVQSIPPAVQALMEKFSRLPLVPSNGESTPAHAEDLATATSADAHSSLGSNPAAEATYGSSEFQTENSAEFASAASRRPQSAAALGQLGGYRLLELLGEGGMGSVFLAEDVHLERLVALKVMRPELAANEDSRRRFLREAKATARLKDDHVVAIYQVGEDNGVPFLTMEYLQGESLDGWLRRGEKMPVSQLLGVARDITRGLVAAHAKGLVHRDIKPANLWLEAPRGRVKILDFGLARGDAEDVRLTHSGTILGTPAFMSPEQGRGEPADSRSDLFSLGCVLYRLCTGRVPFEGASIMAILTALATQDPVPVRQLNPEIPEALEALVMRLLSKRPQDRPASAEAVLQELQALDPQSILSSRTIQLPAASDPWAGIDEDVANRSPEPKSSRQSKRAGTGAKAPRTAVGSRQSGIWNKLLIGAGLLAAFAGILYAAGVIRFETPKGTLVIEGADDDVEVVVKQGGVVIKDKVKAREIELKVGDYNIELAEKGNGLRLNTDSFTITRDSRTPIKVYLEKAVARKNQSGATNDLERKAVAWQPIPVGQSPLDKLDPAKIPAAERFDWQPKELVAVLGEHRQRHWGMAQSIAISVDGKRIATSGNDGLIRFWSPESFVELGSIKVANPGSYVSAVAFTPNGTRLAFSTFGSIGFVDLSGATPVVEKTTLKTKSGVWRLAFTRSGNRLIGWDFDVRQLVIWEFSGSGSKVWLERTLRSANSAPKFGLSIDGGTLAWCSTDKEVTILDIAGAEARELAVFPQPDLVFSLDLSPDGKRVAVGCVDSKVRIWDVGGKPQAPRAVFDSREQPVVVRFSADGKRLAVAYGAVRLWNVEGPEPNSGELFSSSIIGSVVSEIAFTPDRRTMVLAGLDGTVRFWDLSGDAPQERGAIDPASYLLGSQGAGAFIPLVFSKDGKRLATQHQDGMRWWDLNGPAPVPSGLMQGRVPFAVSPTGKTLLLGYLPSWCDLTADIPREGEQYAGGQLPFVSVIRLFPDDKTLAYGTTSGEVRIMERTGLNGLIERARFKAGNERVQPLEISPNGQILATLIAGTVKLWDLSGKMPTLRETLNSEQQITRIAFSPDSRRFVASGVNGVSIVWDVSDNRVKQVATWERFWDEGTAMCLVFSPDGRTLASATTRGRLTLRDPETGTIRKEWQLPGQINWVSYAPDGRHLATVNGNGTGYFLRLSPTDNKLTGATGFEQDRK